MIKLQDVSKYYKTEAGVSVGLVKANLEFQLGEFVAIVGESGSGKTTLLNVISGLDSYEDGEMYLFGEPTSHYEVEDLENYRSTYVGFVFQNYNIIESYTVMQNITYALELQGYPQAEIKTRALELVEQVGLTHRKNSKAAKLSGGEKQRAVIARALAKDCPIIVADEPTGNLDSESGAKVMEILHKISKEKLVIVVSHNYSEVEPYATRKIRIHDGKVVEDIKLKPVDLTAEITKPVIKKFGLKKILKWSFIDLLSKPKRFLFLLIAQFAVMLLFSINYAGNITMIKTMDPVGGSWGKSNYYIDNRINLARLDGQAFTDQEIEDIESSNSEVVSISRNKHQFLDSDRIKQIVKPTNPSIQLNIEGIGHHTIFRNHGKAKLQSGKPAQLINEVIISNNFSNNFQVGETINLRTEIRDEITNKMISENLVITGFSKDNKSIIYFHEDFGKPGKLGFNLVAYDVLEYLKAEIGAGETNVFINSSPETENEITIRSENPIDTIEISIYDKTQVYLKGSTPDLNLVNDEYAVRSVAITKQILEEIATKTFETPYEISLMVSDKIDAERVINRLDGSKYQIITYYDSNQPLNQVFIQVVVIMGTIGGIINLLFLYAILGLVIRNSMNARKKDFAIFRSIGTNQKTLGIMVIVQQIIISVFAYILLMIVVILLGSFARFSIVDFRMLSWYHFFILFFAFMLFSTWLGFRFNKRIFKITVIKNLAIEEVV